MLQTVRKDKPLAGLPALTSWQEDGGPFVTLPLVYTEHPDDRSIITWACIACRCTMTRTTGMHWQIHKGGGFHYHEAEKRNEALPGYQSSWADRLR